jgi:polygalacturonase
MTRRSALVIALAMAAAAGAALAVKETDCLAAVGNQSKGAEAIAAAGPTDKAELPKLAAQTSTSGSLDAGAILSADRATTWNPGVRGAGGIPTRTTVCSTLNPRGGTSDDTAQIQAAINACPAGQVVQLAAGTFLVNSGNYLLINKGMSRNPGC